MSAAAVLVGSRGDSGSPATSVTTGAGNSTGATKFAVFVTWFNQEPTDNPSIAVTDSEDNDFAQAGTNEVSANGDIGVAAFVCESGSGGVSHTATATFNGVANVYGASIELVAITGAAATALDQHAQGNFTTTPYSVTSPTLSQADELILALGGADSDEVGAWSSSNMTLLDSNVGTGGGVVPPLALAAANVDSTSAFTANLTYADSFGTHQGSMCLLTFKSASSSQSYSYTGAGGMALAGAAAQGRVAAPVAAGGLAFSGSSAAARVLALPARTGGVAFAGTGAAVRTKQATSVGGLLFGGATIPLRVVSEPTPSGGISFGGSAQRNTGRLVTPSGGLSFGGMSMHNAVLTVTFAGGLKFSGTAPVSFIGTGASARRIYWQFNQSFLQRYYQLPDEMRRLH